MQKTDYLTLNSTMNLTKSQTELTDDRILKHIIEYYMNNFNNNSDAYDYDADNVIYMDNLNLHQYVLLGWVSLIVTLIGITGNIFTIIILTKPNMKNIVNILMTGLAFSDSISLFLLMFLVPMRYILVSHLSLKFYEMHTLLYPYLYPLTATFQFTSIYMIVVTCSSRMVTVYFPAIMTKFSHNTCYYIIFFILVFSGISCIPLWLKFEVEHVTENNATRLYLKLTELSLDPSLRFYLHIYYIIITYIIPLVILAITNYMLIIFLLDTRKRKHLLGKKNYPLKSIFSEIKISFLKRCT